MTENTTTKTADGELPLYVARPEGATSRAMIVIQEAFGVNAGIRRRCDMFAEAGYLAVAPDLYWRVGSGIELDPDVAPELERGLAILNDFDQDAAVRDIAAAERFVRSEMDAGARVGAIGYCIGGKLSFLAAARTDLDAAVGYYGYGIDQVLGEAEDIDVPFLLHLGRDDQFIDKAAQDAMAKGFAGHPNLELQIHDGAQHGFATEFGQRRNPEAAAAADARTFAFLEKALG